MRQSNPQGHSFSGGTTCCSRLPLWLRPFYSLQGAGAVVLLLLVVVVFVPFERSHVRRAVEQRAATAATYRQKQARMLHEARVSTDALLARVHVAEGLLDALTASADQLASNTAAAASNKEKPHVGSAHVQGKDKHAAALSSDVQAAVDEASRRMGLAVANASAAADALVREIGALQAARDGTFVVKWHQDDLGIRTSARLRTQDEAVVAFDKIGEFAKKMLMFDGQRWVAVREYGGQNWLDLMHDDGAPQEGEFRVTKKP